MATIESAQRKYAEKAPHMANNYVAGMSRFLGFDVSGSTHVAAYREKIGPETAAKWAANLKAAFRY